MTARLLAPCATRPRAAGGAEDVPCPVRFLDLLDLRIPTANDVNRLWAASSGPTTRVPIGADASGTMRVDLTGQGPHTMLAGTNGAGKSVLLQSVVPPLLALRPPPASPTGVPAPPWSTSASTSTGP